MFQSISVGFSGIEGLLVVGVDGTNLLTIVLLQVTDDAVMVGDHLFGSFQLLHLFLGLPDFLAELLDYAHQPLESGDHLLEGAGKLLLARCNLCVRGKELL